MDINNDVVSYTSRQCGKGMIDLSGTFVKNFAVVCRYWQNALCRSRSGTRPQWLCICRHCGKFCVLLGEYIRKDRAKSCGCLRHADTQALRALYNRYKHGAQRGRGKLKFELGIEVFAKLTSSPCHYCRALPHLVSRVSWGGTQTVWGQKHPYGRVYTYNGIDRKDSAVGYVIGNCVPCCETCNFAKHDMSYDDFMFWIKRLIQAHKESAYAAHF